MSSRRSPRLIRFIARLLKVRSEHEGRQLLRATRLVGVFGLLIVAPVALLAYFALASTSDGATSIEADLAPEGRGLVQQILDEEREIFGTFETAVDRRLLRNQSPVNGLDELSPHLIAAYQLQGGTSLVEPFDLPLSEDPAELTPAFERAMQRAIHAEQRGELAEAAERYAEAAQQTTSARLSGEARLHQARLYGVLGVGAYTYADVIGDYGALRDSRGFRIGDVARLNQAELAAGRSPDGALALRELVDMLMGSRWVLFEGGEPTVARRALSKLETIRRTGGSIDPDWLSRTRRSLDRRDAQLYWSGYLFDELAELVDRGVGTEAGTTYRTHPNSPALWAFRRSGQDLIVYAFDRDEILQSLQRSADRLSELKADLVSEIRLQDGSPMGPTVFRRAFDHLPGFEVQVSAADPEGLTEARRRRAATRIAIVLLAIATSVIGVGVTVRYVLNELESARIKTDFAANVSHELRSPITQIRLKGEALQLDLIRDDDDRRAQYDAIVREAERLSRLVDNVLDFAAIERGAKRYTMRPEDPVVLIHSAVETSRANIEGAGMTLELDLPDDLPVVWIDRDAIGQVLINLLSNAVKYGASGKWIGVEARHTGQALELRVRDRGIGIAPEDRNRIFDDFYRSADPRVRRCKGTGIGLTIVRYIVEAHGGRITAEPTPGGGTTFTVHLPLTARDGGGATSHG
ncbi:MAG: sensor histidine kinase [Deltaproteobacteria bacterium]|nr:MAG: sensor histidine kinase [Deltaproteobacteria bacterium]